MTRKEKIINVLETTPNYRRNEKGKIELNYDKIADEILAIPLDVPDNKEIDEFVVLHPDNTRNFILGAGISAGFKVGAEWAIEQVIERNQK